MTEKVFTIVESTVKAIVSIIPMFGSPISSIIGDFSQERYKKRLEQFITRINESLNRRIDDIDNGKISTDDFKDVFSNVMNEVLKTRYSEKRDAITNVLLNTITQNHIEFDEAEYLNNIIISLSIRHLVALQILSPIEVNDIKNSSENVIKTLSNTLSLENEKVLEIVNDLENENLIVGLSSQYVTYIGKSGVSVAGIDSYLTKKGKTLLKMVEDIQATT